jgi:hypothetical protein
VKDRFLAKLASNGQGVLKTDLGERQASFTVLANDHIGTDRWPVNEPMIARILK